MSLSPRRRFEILKRDGFTCRYCGRSAPGVVLVVDHVVATANGGSNEPSNLVTACVECNSGKLDVPLTGQAPAGRHADVADLLAKFEDYCASIMTWPQRPVAARGVHKATPMSLEERLDLVWFERCEDRGDIYVRAYRERGLWTVHVDCIALKRGGELHALRNADVAEVLVLAEGLKPRARRTLGDCCRDPFRRRWRAEHPDDTEAVVWVRGLEDHSVRAITRSFFACPTLPRYREQSA